MVCNKMLLLDLFLFEHIFKMDFLLLFDMYYYLP